MLRILLAIITLAFAATASAQDKPAAAPAEKPARFATTKVEGTDNVYVFRYGNHQAMFVVTSAGVIATDPIGYGRPQAVTTFIITTITSPAANRSRMPAPSSLRTSGPRNALQC